MHCVVIYAQGQPQTLGSQILSEAVDFKGLALQCASELAGLGLLVLSNTLSASFVAEFLANHLEVAELPPRPRMELSLHAQVGNARPLGVLSCFRILKT
jgi:hypothetical protein